MNTQPRKTESELPESSGIDTWSDADILGAFVAGQERAIAAGCTDYHTKPVELPKLLEQIEAILKARPATA